MAHIKNDEIRGYETTIGLFCAECFDGDTSELKQYEILTEHDLDGEDFYFCDKCREQL